MTKYQQILLSSVTVIYFSLVAVWVMPETLLKSLLMPVTKPIFAVMGLDQNWMMFCPTVRDTNYNINITVSFADGSTKLMEGPRLDLYSIMMKVRRQRMNKAFLDAWERPNFSYYWPYIARYAARCNLDPKNEPVMVSLSINWHSIPPIENWVSRENLPGNTAHATYYVYQVRPEDLL